jgi:hypothetical protein
MTLDSLLEEFPWARTHQALCREAPGQGALPLDRAERLISQQRESQLSVLSRAMYAPLLESDYADREDTSAKGDVRETAPLKLRDPKQSSRIFLGAAAQAGTGLRPFGPERLNDLGPSNGALGRLLVVLSVAESFPRRREGLAREWPDIARQGIASEQLLPFGLVLTPMLLAAEPEARASADYTYSESVRQLAETLRDVDESRELTDWTGRLVREGATRLAMLSGGRLRVESSSSEGNLRPRGTHARDVLLAGSREHNEGFLEAVRAIPGVATQTRFIDEENPNLSRVRVWSAHRLTDGELVRLAEIVGVRIVALTDDGVI